jgi:hypothetical protein
MFAIPRMTPLVKGLLVALIAIYVVLAIVVVWLQMPDIFMMLALTPGNLGIHTLWQPFTHALVDVPTGQNVFGFLIGLLFLWWMLAPFEERFGAAWVAKLCAISTVSAAIPAIAVGVFAPALAAGSIVCGAWPWALAALAAFAAIHRNGQVSFFGVIPMRAWVMLAIAIGIAVLQFITSRDVPSFVAQLGAIAGGVGWARWTMRPRSPAKPRAKKKGGNGRPGFRVIQGGRDDDEDDDDDSGPRDRPRWLN